MPPPSAIDRRPSDPARPNGITITKQASAPYPAVDSSNSPSTANGTAMPSTSETTFTTTATPPATSSDSNDFDIAPEDQDNIPHLAHLLRSQTTPLPKRFRALFALKHHASLHPPTHHTLESISAIAAAITPAEPSALLKHELAYCLGQTGYPDAAGRFLRKVVEDEAEDVMVRHEAAEGLGALGDVGSLGLLQGLAGCGETILRETAEVAVGRIEWARREREERLKASDFASVDPAPPFPVTETADISSLRATLTDQSLDLFTRYRAMFTLRDLASPPDLPTAAPAIKALASGFQDRSSALFRHEVAFVFGQLCHPASVPALVEVLKDGAEHGMVRHEAAEALGSLGEEDEEIKEVLRGFLRDEERVVRESVEVALDMAGAV